MEATLADARRALANDAQKLTQFEEGARTIDSEPADAAPFAPTPPSGVAAVPPDTSAPDDQMIRGMVERLAARLRQDGSNVEGWIMLVRSYVALGEDEQARAAVAAARVALANDADNLRRLEDGLKSLGFAG
jgi:cytochrome c-type biogenesis protein CcmH